MKATSIGIISLVLATLLAACQPIQPVPASHEPPEVQIAISDQGITAPAEMPAGVVMVTVNNNSAAATPGECHGVLDLIRLAEGKTQADLMQVLATGVFDPAVGMALGGICVTASPISHAIYNLEPGHYLAMASVGEGAPALAEITVKAGANQAAVPQAEVNAQLVDFSFILPDTIKAGPRLWAISNQGTQWHHMSIIRLNEGATLDQLLETVMAEQPSGSPPAQEMALWEVMTPNTNAWALIDLPPGDYYVLCFLPDMGATPPMMHASKGMVRKLTVTE